MFPESDKNYTTRFKNVTDLSEQKRSEEDP